MIFKIKYLLFVYLFNIITCKILNINLSRPKELKNENIIFEYIPNFS
jgi:hypothetical protein